MTDNVKDLNEDKGYQVFSDLMDAVFELGDELHDRIKEDEELTDVEIGFLDALDDYVDDWQEEMDEEEKENTEDN